MDRIGFGTTDGRKIDEGVWEDVYDLIFFMYRRAKFRVPLIKNKRTLNRLEANSVGEIKI